MVRFGSALVVLALLGLPADDLSELIRKYKEACNKVGGKREERPKKVEQHVAPVVAKIGGIKTPQSMTFLAGELDKAPVPEIAALIPKALLRNPDPRAVTVVLNGFFRRPASVQTATLTALAKTKHDLKLHQSAVLGLAGGRISSDVKQHLPPVLGRLRSVAAFRTLLKLVGTGKPRDRNEEAYNNAVFETIKKSADRDVKAWLATGAFDDAGSQPQRLRIVVDLIGSFKLEDARPKLERALRHSGAGVAKGALAALVRIGVKGSHEAVARAVESRAAGGEVRFRIEALDALARANTDAAIAAVARCCRSRDALTRNVAMGSLALADNPRAVPPLVEGLNDSDASVRAVALRSLSRFRTKSLVRSLIGALEKQKDEEFKGRIVEMLVDMTGKNLGMIADDWRRWWDVAEEEFDLSKIRSRSPVTVSYFGLGIFSTRLSLLVDISGSMKSQVAVKSGGKKSRARKIDVLKSELERLLRRLSEDTRLNMIKFDRNVHPWKKRLQALKGNGRASAVRYAKGLKTSSGTNVFDSLEYAIKDRQVDTIYLLTDGAPTAGRLTKPDEILREVAKLNRLRAVTIHCIAFGAHSDFLKKLAKANGGKYRFVDSY